VPLLSVEKLSLAAGGRVLVREVSLSLAAGRVLGLIGGSGSGKSLTALSVIGLLPAGIRRSGVIRLDGQDLTDRSELELCAIRGRDIGMVFQEPLTALNPVMTVGAQVAEGVMQHRRVSRRQARAEADRVLAEVELPAQEVPRSRYPHQLSGGQRQRVAIAMAIALRPKLLIADEPTTALDVTTQAQILRLLARLVKDAGTSLLFISHDLPVVAGLADEVAILDRGELVEHGPALEVLSHPRHACTQALVRAAAPAAIAPARPGAAASPVLEARHISHDYPLPRAAFWQRRRHLRAVDDVSFHLHEGETLAIVGESGSGKSTLLRQLLALVAAQQGEVLIRGRRFPGRDRGETRRLRRRIQAVFQDPYASLDPRWRIADVVSEPLGLLDEPLRGTGRLERARAALEAVGLDAAALTRLPREFSGGERQRIALARALILEPDIIVLDEATSALDSRVRQQILDLLADLARTRQTAFVFVTHDMATVRRVAGRVLVLKEGRVVEAGDTAAVFAAPQHPYTATLLAAAPDLGQILAGRRSPAVAAAPAQS
jgi:peptide/nickel transport system ATP-binding protein